MTGFWVFIGPQVPWPHFTPQASVESSGIWTHGPTYSNSLQSLINEIAEMTQLSVPCVDMNEQSREALPPSHHRSQQQLRPVDLHNWKYYAPRKAVMSLMLWFDPKLHFKQEDITPNSVRFTVWFWFCRTEQCLIQTGDLLFCLQNNQTSNNQNIMSKGFFPANRLNWLLSAC